MPLRRLALVVSASAALLAAGALAPDEPRAAAPPPAALPPLEAPYPLPPLPERSERNASYTIEARLDPEAHTLEGSLVLDWRNTAGVPLSSFPFHLYWNAFRNNRSTSASEDSRRRRDPVYSEAEQERRFGFIHVRSVRLLGEREADLTPSRRFLQPDDGNAEDRTVMEVTTAAPLRPGETARFRIEWSARIPFGDVGRSGWVHDYHFIAQWFPKIAVHWKGEWNAHQFHANPEFFADYGNYDVRLTLPEGFVVGATGRRQGEPLRNHDGTQTVRFVQEDVHDFAWTASRRFLERTGRFEAPGYPPVEIRLLLQPEHAHLAERYLAATRMALQGYGAWSAPYPYRQITVVDPAWRSRSGGMEYPTLFTGGASISAPPALQSPESVTIHEAGHQFWYGLVANNEFEEAWLDEGFNTYFEGKTRQALLGPEAWGQRYFGLLSGSRSRGGLSVVAPGVWIGQGEERLSSLRQNGQADVMARRGWEYRNGGSYTLNSYGKPALSLQTLEALVGDETMTRILRTYARRFRFRHPTSQDFIDTVNEVTGKDYRWFFDETWFSSELCDYAIAVRSREAPRSEGFVDAGDGAPAPAPRDARDAGGRPPAYDVEVVVERRGGVRLPVEVLIEFADGSRQTESWDGRDRWTRFKYRRAARPVRAVVDPERKLALDVNPSNNSWLEEQGVSRRAAAKWAGRWMLWLQNLLELHALLG